MRKLLFLLVVVLMVSTLVAQGEKESYSALAVGTSGSVEGETIKIGISIDRYTEDEELGDYLMLLYDGKYEEARKTLETVVVGHITPESEAGVSICAARSVELNGKKVIRLLTVHPVLERYRADRDEDHPFTMIELRLDADGTGVGSAKGGTKIKFENGILSFERSGNRYAELANVRTND